MIDQDKIWLVYHRWVDGLGAAYIVVSDSRPTASQVIDASHIDFDPLTETLEIYRPTIVRISG